MPRSVLAEAGNAILTDVVLRLCAMGPHAIPAFSVSAPRQAALAWVRRQIRRIPKVLWWIVTLQLHRRFSDWRQAKRLRQSLVSIPLRYPLLHDVDASTIKIHTSVDPLVSIIIPTYGKADFTLRCLASIAAYPPDAPIEVLVVDDASPDGCSAQLAAIAGIRLIINPRNLGYLRSCNAAARVSKGKFLLFLNNDTQVLPHWLDPLLKPFAEDLRVGAAGSKLLYPDGSLQEAGGIIWSDGSGWNYGRYDDPERPIYNYRREVDYCSAASLMVPRSLFDQLGGFDERYAPAYCEDSDLAFRLRDAGYKVIYQPRSQIVHYEGISHGRDEAHGIKAFQIRNQRIFRARWQSVLARDHLPNGSHVMRARDRAKQRDVILLIDHYVPEPDRDAGSRTTLCMIQALQSLGLAIKFWPHNLHYSPGYTDALQDLGVEVIYGCDGDAFRDWLADNAEDLTFVLLCRPQVALDFLPELKRYPHIGRLYYGADLHFRRMRLQAQVEEDRSIGRQAAHMEKLERCVWRDVDVALYPSDEEAAAVRALEPRVVARTLLPYCFSDFAMQRRPPSEPAILFVAGFAHPPNRHAALWFVEQVLPAIRARVPAVQLSIVGSNPTAEVRELASAGVRVHANVSEQVLREYYACARVAVVPLHYGAGVKLKVVEALREGLPLVTTSIGAQGLPDLKDIVSIEDDAASFADAVCRLLTDDLLWARRSAAQVDYAAARYSHAAFRASLADALAQVPSRCATRLAS